MNLTFLGATQTVTGSRFLLNINDKNILIDCGLFQGYKSLRLRNWEKFPIDPANIDAIILTHAHIDHTGYLPVMIKQGFKGKVFSTAGTKSICQLLLADCGFLQEEDARRANKYHYTKHHPALPLYTQEEGMNTANQIIPLEFNKSYKLFNVGVFEFLPAGHIIGSALIRIFANGKTITFTGDLGRPHDALMKPPAKVAETDYLVIESTYGDRLHQNLDPLDQLEDVINRTAARGGAIVIPAFAVGRTQDLLYYIHQLKITKRIADIPVFLDSPMAQDVSDMMTTYAGEHTISKEMCETICKEAKYVNTAEESKAIDQHKLPIIIISASGMLEGGRILHHLSAFITDERSSIVLTGYQAGGTRGDKLLRKETGIRIHGQMFPVKAEVVELQNLSAHADYEEMLQWLKQFKRPPVKTFIVHGELASSESLKNKLELMLDWNCVIPEYLQQEKL